MRWYRLGAVVAAVTAILTLGLGACGSSNPSRTSSPDSTAPVMSIDIHTFMFQPNPAHVKAGTTITVTNLDGTNHSLTADNGSFDTGVFSTGSKTITIARPGTYTIHCSIHNFMTGTIVVS